MAGELSKVQGLGNMQGLGSFQFRWLASLPLLIVTVLLVMIALSALIGAHTTQAPMREALFDYYQRLKPAEATASSPFHVVVIDQESVENVGPWPWPRTILADLVDRTAAAGAKAVLITEPLDTPDLLSPETIGEFWLQGAQDEALAEQLRLLPQTNEVLAQSLSKLPAGIGFAWNAYATLDDVTFARSDLAQSGGLIATTDNAGSYVALPVIKPRYPLDPTLNATSDAMVLSLPADRDGIVRRAYPFWTQGAQPNLSASIQAARLALDLPTVQVRTDRTATTSQGKLVNRLSLGNTEIELEGQGTLRFYTQRRTPITTTAAWKLLDGSASQQPLDGAVVLIGRAEDGQVIRTAKGRLAPVEVHAMLAEQVYRGISLKRPAMFGYMEAIAVMLLGAGAIMLAQRTVFWQAIAFAFGGSLILFALSATLFFTNSWLINPILPSLAMFLGVFSIAGGKSVGTVLLDDNVRGAFKGMLPENAMKALRDDRTRKVLSGVKRKVTVLSCELRITDDDLDTFEESPNNVSQIMAAASHNLRSTITKIGGTVDQAEGGRMFAYFNVPLEAADHVEKACAAALAMIESMDKTNAELSAAASTKNVQVHLAIGIATGTCFAGPMGHGRNNRYSAIGQAVDIATFLRRQSEYYGPAIICDESVHRESHHKFAFLEIDSLNTKFHEKPMHVHALIGNPFIKSSKSFRELDTSHRALIQAYRSGDMKTARTSLKEVRTFPAANINLFDIYEERIKTLEKKGLPADWNGTHQAAL